MFTTKLWLSFCPSSRALNFDPLLAQVNIQPLLRTDWTQSERSGDLLFSHATFNTLAHSGSIFVLLSVKENPFLSNSREACSSYGHQGLPFPSLGRNPFLYTFEYLSLLSPGLFFNLIIDFLGGGGGSKKKEKKKNE